MVAGAFFHGVRELSISQLNPVEAIRQIESLPPLFKGQLQTQPTPG